MEIPVWLASNIAALRALLTTALLLVTCAANADERREKFADDFSSRVATAWFELLYDVVKAEKTPPPQAGRIYGITAVALYESIVQGTKEHRSLAGQLNGLRQPTESGKADSYHWPAVASAAMAHTIRALFPTLSPNALGAVAKLEQKLTVEFRKEVAGRDFERSDARGRAVAAMLNSWAATDGFALYDNCFYATTAAADRWRPTPPHFGAKPLQPCWGELRPMVLKSGQECAAPGPPKFSNHTASDFYRAGFEVYKVGQSLTSEQKLIAEYWADNPGESGTPPGHWIDIVSQIARKDKLSLALAAEAYARVGIAAHDAFISCWNTKYVYNSKRPVTYINDNFQGQWRSYVATPNFPSYPSGHSVQSAAAAAVLTDMFGHKSFTDTTHADHNLTPARQPRTFKSFYEAAAEAAVSRLYGGIHYAFDNNDGLQSGECIGQRIIAGVKFR
jgi:hypothetical protein